METDPSIRRGFAATMAFLAGISFMLAGCETPPPKANVAFYLRSPEDLRNVQRVVFVELPATSAGLEVSTCFSDAIAQAIASQRLFHIEVIRRDDPVHDLLPTNRRRPFTIEELRQIRDALRVDAVLVGDITTYKPYPHMKMGVYLRLLDLKNGRLVWSVDDTWDAQQKDIEKRIEYYFHKNVGDQYDPVDWRLATVSPIMFQKFVAYEISQTLRVDPPQPLETAK